MLVIFLISAHTLLTIALTNKLYFFNRSANLCVSDKSERLLAQQTHLSLAEEAREFYRNTVKQAKRGEIIHLSFDFAQQV